MLPAFIQRILPVYSKEDLVIVLQGRAQDLPVDDLIIRDEDQPLSVGRMKFIVTFQHGLRFPPCRSKRKASASSGALFPTLSRLTAKPGSLTLTSYHEIPDMWALFYCLPPMILSLYSGSLLFSP